MDDDLETGELLIIHAGDAIKVSAISPKGEMLLEKAGSDVWIVKRIHMTPYLLNFEPGILATAKPDHHVWIKFNDDDLTFEPCLN